MCYFWFTRYFAYFGLLFSIESLGNQIQQNFTLLAIIEVIAALVSSISFLPSFFNSFMIYFKVPLKLRLKRRQAMKSALIMITIFSLLLSLIKIPKECLTSEDYCLSEEAAIFLAIVIFYWFKRGKY